MRTMLRVTVGALVVLPLVAGLAMVSLSSARDEPRRFEPVVIEQRADITDGQRFTRRSGDTTGRGAGAGPQRDRPDDGGDDPAPEQREGPGDADDGVAVVGPGPTRVDDDDDDDDDGSDRGDGERDDTDD